MPLDDLWRSLTYVACKQTSTQRLKAIQLLLHIIATQHNCLPKVKSPVAFESSPNSLELPRPLEPSHSKMAIDLSLLHPLWILYGKITSEEEESGTLQEPVVRALTELFLQVENLALVRANFT